VPLVLSSLGREGGSKGEERREIEREIERGEMARERRKEEVIAKRESQLEERGMKLIV
jgi:hypothetical protein